MKKAQQIATERNSSRPHTWYCRLCWRSGDSMSSHRLQVEHDEDLAMRMALYLPGVERPALCPGDIQPIDISLHKKPPQGKRPAKPKLDFSTAEPLEFR